MDKIDLLLKNGWLILKKVYDSEKINHLLKCAINTHEKFLKLGGINNKNGVHIEHQFTYEDSFLEVVENELVCKIIEKAIGDNIILINTALDNRQILDNKSNPEEWGGTSWHTDSHYIQKGKVRLNYGFSYLAILCLDKFTKMNGATQYIENSHKVFNKPNRILDSNIYKPKSLEADPGDIILVDTALWHRAGIPSKERRWGMISMYGPWFVKPYFNFTKMFNKSEILNLSPNLLNLLHFTSTPPNNQIQRINTKITPKEFINEFKLL
tara:strand:+ start:35 stop:838 length:804 start_codon:yes stop_codon:yes gene_type:complete